MRFGNIAARLLAPEALRERALDLYEGMAKRHQFLTTVVARWSAGSKTAVTKTAVSTAGKESEI